VDAPVRHAAEIGGLDLQELFATDPGRGTRMTARVGDVLLDYSKNLVTDETVDLLVALGQRADVPGRFAAMRAGEHLNTTEDRAVLHTALRAPRDAAIQIDGLDVIADVHATLDRMAQFADAVRTGRWRGYTGAAVTTVVNVGIGGSCEQSRRRRSVPLRDGNDGVGQEPVASRCTAAAVSASGAATRQNTVPESSSNQYRRYSTP